MKALLVSLLTSDAFLYRTRSEPALAEANWQEEPILELCQASASRNLMIGQ